MLVNRNREGDVNTIGVPRTSTYVIESKNSVPVVWGAIILLCPKQKLIQVIVVR